MQQLFRAMNLAHADMLVDQALIDIGSGKPEHEEWGLGELNDIAKAPDLRGTEVAHRAECELRRIMKECLVVGVMLNGQPITREILSFLAEFQPVALAEIPELSGKRTCISPRRFEKRQFLGPRRKMN